MRRNLFLYTLLIVGLISCTLDSKLSGNKEKKNNSDVKEVLNNVQENAINNLYYNKEAQQDSTKNFGELKDDKLIVVPIELAKSLESIEMASGAVDRILKPVEEESVDPMMETVRIRTSNNKVEIPSILIQHKQKKEDLIIPSTKEEERADKAIKGIESIIRGFGFSKLIEDVYELRNEYHLIRNDFHEVITKIYEKKTSLMKDFSSNEGKIRKLVQFKIRELVQLQNNLKIEGELDQLIVHIDAAEQGIRSAAFFFDEAQKSLKEGIIKRLESRNRLFDASRLSRRALNKAEDALSNLESSSSKKIEAMGRSKIIKNLIQHAKTILSKFE